MVEPTMVSSYPLSLETPRPLVCAMTSAISQAN